MHPIKSIVARKQTYVLNHFKNSKYAKRLSALKDIHKGQRCFIVANGPSLRTEDLNVLADKKDITFGMNRIYKIFDNTRWRPTYYCCEDINIFNESLNDINNIPASKKFIPLNHKFYDGIDVKDAYYFNPNYFREKDFKYSFSDDITVQIDCLGTVTFTCFEIAAYMGFSEIYLLGVDHNYRVTINEDGETVVDNSVKDYFVDDYDKDIEDIVVHNMGNNTIAYRKAKQYCDENGIKIFNATRGGKLEVFPRVCFDDIFKG